MIVNEALLLKLEKLAKLQLVPEERARLQEDLQRILQMVEQLQAVDTTGVAPLTHVSEAVSILRTDEVWAQWSHEEALRNAPHPQTPYFAVPKFVQRG